MGFSKPSQNIIESYNLNREIIRRIFISYSLEKEKAMLHYLNQIGLDRKEIYCVLLYMNLFDNTLTEVQNDLIGDLLDTLSGFCDINYAKNYIRFQDDPIDENDFLSYMGTIAYGWS